MSTDMFHTLDEADVRGKRVLVRVDLNVPVENGKVADTTRIERVAPTIREIADKGGKVILLSHFGRPKGPDPAQSLKLLTPAIAAVLGGAKVSTKLDLLGSLLAKVDTLIIGGGMANTFLAACGHSVGKSLCEHDLLPTAREIMAKAKAKGRELVLPVDAVVAKTF